MHIWGQKGRNYYIYFLFVFLIFPVKCTEWRKFTVYLKMLNVSMFRIVNVNKTEAIQSSDKLNRSENGFFKLCSI